MRLIPALYRILATVLLLLAGIAAGAVGGLTYESNRRDALELKQARQDGALFMEAIGLGRRAAANAIEWKRRARIYYRNWQERLNHENDTNLAQCQAQPGQPAQAGIHVVLLGPAWVGLYNAAWLPEFDQGDTGGTAYQIVEAGGPSTGLRTGVTPREAIDNVRINAELCGEDRKRLDELIDFLMKTGAR